MSRFVSRTVRELTSVCQGTPAVHLGTHRVVDLILMQQERTDTHRVRGVRTRGTGSKCKETVRSVSQDTYHIHPVVYFDKYLLI